MALHPDIKTGVRGWQGHCLPSQPVHLPGSRQTGSYWSGVSSTPHRSGSTKAGRNAETLPESQQVCVPTGLDLRLWALPSLGLPGSWDFFPIAPLPPHGPRASLISPLCRPRVPAAAPGTGRCAVLGGFLLVAAVLHTHHGTESAPRPAGSELSTDQGLPGHRFPRNLLEAESHRRRCCDNDRGAVVTGSTAARESTSSSERWFQAQLLHLGPTAGQLCIWQGACAHC